MRTMMAAVLGLAPLGNGEFTITADGAADNEETER